MCGRFVLFALSTFLHATVYMYSTYIHLNAAVAAAVDLSFVPASVGYINYLYS